MIIGGSVTKDEFLKILLEEGYTCEKGGAYPSVVCDAKDVRKTAKKIKDIAKKNEYNESFAIRSFREGMELISKNGAASKDTAENENDSEVKDTTDPISEPIPMTASVQDETA